METTAHAPAAENVRALGCAGWVGLSLAAVTVLVHVVAPEWLPLSAAAVLGVVLGGLGVINLYLAAQSRRDVTELSSNGLRNVASGRTLGWQDLAGLRCDGAIRLAPRSDGPELTIPLDVDEFPALMDRLLAHAPRPAKVGGQFSCARVSPGAVALTLMLVLAILGPLLAPDTFPRAFWFAVPVLAAVLYFDLGQLWRLDIANDRVLLRYGFRTERLVPGQVSALRLERKRSGKGIYSLEVVVDVKGRARAVVPRGSDPFEVYFALESVSRRSVA